jgi:hypothetical protein
MSNPIKIVLLTGNVKSDSLFVKLHPISEYMHGRWNLCISQMIYHLKEITQVDQICGISTNFVKGTKYTESNEIETIFQPLNIFILQGKNNQKKTIQFEKTWSLINNFSEDLKIYINSLVDNKKVNIDCEIYILVLLQRIA